MSPLEIVSLWKREFTHYSVETFRKDLLAGLTVGAVSLPLALAFGVASGATAPAGIVTAILAGLVIGALSGAPYQISGPTGAMSAVLILLVQRYGLPGVWLAGVLAGIFILAVGLLRLGRFIAFIPAPVITGFTSGIALIIFIGQIDNFLGVTTPGAESTLLKLFGYFTHSFSPDWRAMLIAALVIGVMVAWPPRWAARFPGSLLGLIVATLCTVALSWDIRTIGAIPSSLLLEQRLMPSMITLDLLGKVLAPAISIAALGAVESLLCGAVGSNMTGVRLHANQELIAQGVGNILIPFFGGVPATAAIARTSVGIKSGGVTRLVSIIHSLVLLAAALVLGPVMARVPLAALAGVLMVTAVRMNEWRAIRFIFGKRFKTGMITFSLTLLATVALDLTQAILVGVALSAAAFLSQAASITIEIQPVDRERLRVRGIELHHSAQGLSVAYISGPLFFAATSNFSESFHDLHTMHGLILSLRAMPMIDVSGLESVLHLHEQLHQQGGTLMLAGMHPSVEAMLARSGLLDKIGRENIFWSADQAIVAWDTRQA